MSAFVLSCDPGLATFGSVVIKLGSYEDRCVFASTFTSKPSNKKQNIFASDDRVRRARSLQNHLEDIGEMFDIVAIASESMSFPRGTNAVCCISLAWGVLAAFSEERRIPIVSSMPKEWRKYVCSEHGVEPTEDNSHASSLLDIPSAGKFIDSINPESLRVHARDALGVFCWARQTDVIRIIRSSRVLEEEPTLGSSLGQILP